MEHMHKGEAPSASIRARFEHLELLIEILFGETQVIGYRIRPDLYHCDKQPPE